MPEPHPERVGELKYGSQAPGSPDREIGATPVPRLVIAQTRRGREPLMQRVGEDDRIFERLAGALPQIGGRGMDRVVAQERDAPCAPNTPRRPR